MDVEIELFDDPLSPRGWGAQPALRALRVALDPDGAGGGDASVGGEAVPGGRDDASGEAEGPAPTWRLRPTVLVRDWDRYDGPEFPAGRSSVAAVCARVGEESGMPIDEFLWFDDPPTSSEPACRAVAAVVAGGAVAGDGETVAGDEETGGEAVDSGAAAERFLRACREATFVRRRNLDSPAAVCDLARDVDGVDADRVEVALARDSDPTPTADALDVSGVTAAGDRPELPTVVVRGPAGAQGASGRLDWNVLAGLVEAATGARPDRPSLSVDRALDRFSSAGWVATAELVELCGADYEHAASTAADLPGVVNREFAAEPFWRRREDVEAAAER